MAARGQSTVSLDSASSANLQGAKQRSGPKYAYIQARGDAVVAPSENTICECSKAKQNRGEHDLQTASSVVGPADDRRRPRDQQEGRRS